MLLGNFLDLLILPTSLTPWATYWCFGFINSKNWQPSAQDLPNFEVQRIPFGLGLEIKLLHMPFEGHYSEITIESERLLKIIQFPVLIEKECPAYLLPMAPFCQIQDLQADIPFAYFNCCYGIWGHVFSHCDVYAFWTMFLQPYISEFCHLDRTLFVRNNVVKSVF